jgi:hypothetical protein
MVGFERARLIRIVCLAFLLEFAAPAVAQRTALNPQPEDIAPPGDTDDPHLYENWVLRFEPAVWYVAPGGRFHLPGEPAGTEETWVSDVNLDSPRASPFGELHLRTSEKWRFTFSAFSLEQENRGTIANDFGTFGPHAYSPGDPLEASLNLVSGEITAAWRLPFELGKKSQDFEGRAELIGGARFIDFGLELSAPSGTVSEDLFYLEPIVGFKVNLEVTQQFTIDLQNTFGYWSDGADKRSMTWDILVGFMYFPLENVGIQIGYRQLLLDLEEGKGEEFFEYHGAAAGVYGGLSIRF